MQVQALAPSIINQSISDDDSDSNNENAFECYDTRLDQNICLQIMMIKRLTLLKMKPDCFDTFLFLIHSFA